MPAASHRGNRSSKTGGTGAGNGGNRGRETGPDAGKWDRTGQDKWAEIPGFAVRNFVLVTLRTNQQQPRALLLVFDGKEMDKEASEIHRRNGVRKTFIGRDELNLAEFPVAALADRVPAGQKTLVFEDRIRDYGKGKPVLRRVTIAASPTYGLPTALDDEVLVGLIQITSPKFHRLLSRISLPG